jgi:hypothetical protein
MDVDLQPGWLARDVARASARLAKWEATSARLTGRNHSDTQAWNAWLSTEHHEHEAALASELAERAEMWGMS